MERVGVEEFLIQALGNVENLSEDLKQALQQAAQAPGNPVEAIKRAIREGTRG